MPVDYGRLFGGSGGRFPVYSRGELHASLSGGGLPDGGDFLACGVLPWIIICVIRGDGRKVVD